MLMKNPQKTNAQRVIETLESIRDDQFSMCHTLMDRTIETIHSAADVIHHTKENLVGCIAGWALVTMTPEELDTVIMDGHIAAVALHDWLGVPNHMQLGFFGVR